MANKPTAVHFTLIFFVMTTIIGGVVSYLFFTDLEKARTDLVKAKSEASTSTNALRTANEGMTYVKGVIGYTFGDMGANQDGSQNPNTVMGAIKRDLELYGGPEEDPSVSLTLKRMREKIDELESKYSGSQSTITSQETTHTAKLDSQLQSISTYKSKKDDAEAEVATLNKEKNEAIQQKNAEIQTSRTALLKKTAEYDDFRQETVTKLKEKDVEIANLTQINDQMRKKLWDLEKTSFDNPDGRVQFVDHSAGLVWVNLGSDDGVPIRTTFSVYGKSNQGVGQVTTQEDIKGSIEITKITGPHLSEARITSDDITNPMTKGDVIFTPLWTAGQKYRFSFIGELDIDNDGRSDRELLHDMIASADASIDNEVDDEGNRTGEKITVHTKFLIFGEIPDPSEVQPKDRERALKIMKHRANMVKEAREAGVRHINLGDFMSFMGFSSKRRVFRPGDRRPYNLRAGAASTATNQTVGDRSAAGKVSDLYKKGRRLPPGASSGQTSKRFGN